MKNTKLKKYQREKFANYMRHNKVKITNNEAYISLYVKDLKSITSKYSTNENLIIEKSFYDEIEFEASYMSLEYPLVLEIQNENFSSEEKIILRDAIKEHFELKNINKKEDLKTLKRKSIYFLICGIIFFFLVILLNILDKEILFEEIIVFLGSFSFWEFFELILFDQDELKEKILINEHLSNVRVIYNKI